MLRILLLFVLAIIIGICLGWFTFSITRPKSLASQTTSFQGSPAPTTAFQVLPNPIASALNSLVPTAHSLKEFNLTSSNYKFVPNLINVKLGDKVRINLKNTEGLHNISVPAYNVFSPQIGNNQTAQVEFIADEKGSFEFYCDVENHQQMGMIGNLVVE